ncbi:glycyl-tRNA synthetase alpha subunit [Ezakiella coagulans]|uniref:Glycyl-tRNA synthetase alpha subunit n=1 Tax=Ezakiella coagulans TaxID=46507 RepID=A0A2U1E290_9FIRM|nr:glycine--tRNA ligase subunit alpha [Ezakiella coagulans]PVY94066.1 glycyl-tRNA synthetase alpha subunit [Ezakiella coagulans]
MKLVDELNNYYRKFGLKKIREDYIELNEDVLSYSELFFHLDNPNSISGANVRVLNVGDMSFSIQGTKRSVSSIYRVVDQRKHTVNFKDVFLSLKHIFGNMDDYLFTYNSGDYHEPSLGATVSYSNIYANGFLIVKCKYFQTINDEHLESIPLVIEYNLNNLSYVFGDEETNEFSVEQVRDSEFSSYIFEEIEFENENILFTSHISESEIHLREKRYILAYISLIKSCKDVEIIKGKTGIFSEKYIDNMKRIREIYFEIKNEYLNQKAIVDSDGLKEDKDE